jgi:thiazole synthase ThiGH ThiG subunit
MNNLRGVKIIYQESKATQPSHLYFLQKDGNYCDAGIGKPSQACEAMEMGAAAVMANTAIATAGNVPAMAEAFKKAIEAGRSAYLTGMGRVLARGGSASDPLTGFLR